MILMSADTDTDILKCRQNRHRHRHQTDIIKFWYILHIFHFFFQYCNVTLRKFWFKNKIFDAFQGLVYFYKQTGGYIFHSVEQIPKKCGKFEFSYVTKSRKKVGLKKQISADTDTKTDMSVNHYA